MVGSLWALALSRVVCGGGGSLPRPAPARSLRIALAYCRAAQWRHTLREARLHDHHRLNVGSALGTRYRVSSCAAHACCGYLLCTCIASVAILAQGSSRCRGSTPPVYAGLTFESTACRWRSSPARGELRPAPVGNGWLYLGTTTLYPRLLAGLPQPSIQSSRWVSRFTPREARPRSFVDTGLAHRAPSSGAYGNQPSVCLRRSTETSSRAQRVLRALVQLQLFSGGVAQRHPLGFCTR